MTTKTKLTLGNPKDTIDAPTNPYRQTLNAHTKGKPPKESEFSGMQMPNTNDNSVRTNLVDEKKDDSSNSNDEPSPFMASLIAKAHAQRRARKIVMQPQMLTMAELWKEGLDLTKIARYRHGLIHYGTLEVETVSMAIIHAFLSSWLPEGHKSCLKAVTCEKDLRTLAFTLKYAITSKFEEHLAAKARKLKGTARPRLTGFARPRLATIPEHTDTKRRRIVADSHGYNTIEVGIFVFTFIFETHSVYLAVC